MTDAMKTQLYKINGSPAASQVTLPVAILIPLLASGSGTAVFALSVFLFINYSDFILAQPPGATIILQTVLVMLRFSTLLTAGAALYLRLRFRSAALIGLLLATVGCDLMQILSEYLFFGR